MTLSAATARMYQFVGSPTINDDNTAGYEVGNFWQNTVSGSVYQARSVNTGAANWVRYIADGDACQLGQTVFESGIIYNVTIPGAYPYTILSSDYFILIDSVGGTRTVNLPATPATGTSFILKDNGNATLANVTISGNGNNIDGSASLILASDYEAVNVIFNGSEWSVY